MRCVLPPADAPFCFLLLVPFEFRMISREIRNTNADPFRGVRAGTSRSSFGKIQMRFLYSGRWLLCFLAIL